MMVMVVRIMAVVMVVMVDVGGHCIVLEVYKYCVGWLLMAAAEEAGEEM
jgi:hypothetical protein